MVADYEVAVVGGGIAGISAALSAARAGAKTILIEQQYCLGGLTTLSFVTIYLPLCNGHGNQVSFGIAEEFFQLSLSLCEGKLVQKEWRQQIAGISDSCLPRYECTYNPNVFSILTEQLLLDNGVKIRYGVPICDTVVENGNIKALIIKGKTGRETIAAKSVVDTTGNAAICQIAGAQAWMEGRLKGIIELQEPKEYRYYKDSIGMIGNWCCSGPIYEIPFSCLYGNEVKNLVAAGRCISAKGTMRNLTSVIPACAVTGEAAGAAAAMCDDFSNISLSEFQNLFRKRRIPLHRSELKRYMENN